MKIKLTVYLMVALFAVGLTGALIIPTALADASQFVGTWNTTWKSDDGREVKAVVRIKTDSGNSNSLDGIVEVPGADGGMFGDYTAATKTWSGAWYNADGQKGTFTFKMAKDNKSFDGSYTINGKSGSFNWKGNK